MVMRKLNTDSNLTTHTRVICANQWLNFIIVPGIHLPAFALI
jgi:hypothetical protein